MPRPTIDAKRLWSSLMELAKIGATPKGGVRRVTLTEADREGRERFAQWCGEAGLQVRVDAIGNMFARRAGREPDAAPVVMGSHLDTQPNGGRFDGAYMFIYSPRPGTAAATMGDQVDPAVASERFSRLAELQREISLQKNQALVGATVEVLSEGPSRKDPALITARTRTNKVVHVPGTHPSGTFLEARLEHAAPSHLVGTAV